MDLTREGLEIALDGPSGVGKGTLGRALSVRLGLPYLDSGSMYRALTVVCLRWGLDVTDGATCGEVASTAVFTYREGVVCSVNGEDVSGEIRSPETTQHVSAVSAHPQVRTPAVVTQRAYVREVGGIVDGRDIGRTVLPNAAVKLFLTASTEAAALRRAAQTGVTDLDGISAVARDIARRDRLDSTRAISPLMAAEDAFRIDNSDLTAPQTLQIALDHIFDRVGVRV